MHKRTTSGNFFLLFVVLTTLYSTSDPQNIISHQIQNVRTLHTNSGVKSLPTQMHLHVSCQYKNEKRKRKEYQMCVVLATL